MKKGLVYSHQAWTDTLNLLGLYGYYASIYDEVLITVIDKMYENVRFFSKSYPNMRILKISEEDHDLEKTGKKSLYKIFEEHNINLDEYDILIHGWSDHIRPDHPDAPKREKDKYRGVYGHKFDQCHFARGFYEHYEIDYVNKVSMFNVKRDLELEEVAFQNFLNKNGVDRYILYHSDPSRNFGLPIRVPVLKQEFKYISLDGMASDIFSTIKILEKSEEIHLIDSVWATFCYLLDAKYGLFKDKKIYLYPLFNRPGGCLNPHFSPNLFLDPIQLPNWKITNCY